MDFGRVSKAIAGAVAAGISTPGATAVMIPDGVDAPWWGYVLAGTISAGITFASIYFAKRNTLTTGEVRQEAAAKGLPVGPPPGLR